MLIELIFSKFPFNSKILTKSDPTEWWTTLGVYNGPLRGVGFPPVILYSCNEGVIFAMFLCDGLFWEFVVTVCDFYELDFSHIDI